MAAVKALQQWCRIQCEGYRDVAITNMTTSFRDGLAFCALIHKHRPDLIKFDSLNKENVYDNNKLAFMVAEEQLGIPALLDAEDMVALRVPDRLSILTYVSQYYNYFHGRSPIGGMAGIKRPAEGPTDEPSGKKNQPVVAKVFPSSKPARENSPPPSSNIVTPSPAPRQTKNVTQDMVVEKPHPSGTLSNKCASCDKHVHLVQRHLVEGKLYHRSCAKLQSHSNTTAPLRPLPTNTPVSKVTPPPDSTKTNTASPASQTASGTTFTTTTTVTTRPVAAPRTSHTAERTQQAKLKFFQSENTTNNDEKKTTTFNIDVNKGPKVVNTGGTGRKEPAGVGGKVSSKQEDNENNKAKASAAAFISKKLVEENNNNNSKPSWTTVSLKKADKPQPQVETPKRETGFGKGRVKLKANPAFFADLQSSDTPSSAPSPASKGGFGSKTPDRGSLKPGSTSPNTAAASENESPADWRSKLKPVTKESKPVDQSQSLKPFANGAGKQQTSANSVGPASSSSVVPSPIISVTPPVSKGFTNDQKDKTANSKNTKKKSDYIPEEDIEKELQEIEDNLNELEKTGVELEVKLRKSEEEGEDDSVMDELMVEWFNLIRTKQLAVRRESELVYIKRTQELEEEQPSVEQELRRLMEKPDHMKTNWDRKKEEQLMAKLVEIVNDRNAIIEGLDEDRLREEEEDQELNKLMMNLNIKKDKPKKKSPMAKLFNWGNKKEG